MWNCTENDFVKEILSLETTPIIRDGITFFEAEESVSEPPMYIPMKWGFTGKIGGYMMKRDLVDELYKIAYKRYREKYPNKDFASIPNFLDSLWFSIEGELNRNGYDAARKYVEEADLIVLRWMVRMEEILCI